MTAGSGPTSPMPFAHYDPDSCSWRTSRPSLFEDSQRSPIRWPRSGTTSRGRAYERPTSAPPIVGSAGSALLGTPMTTSGCGPGDLSSRRNQTRLETQVVLLPTPRASENENRQTKRSPSQEAGTHGKNLAAEVCELLPTPTASNPNDGEDLQSWEARRRRNLTKKVNGNGQGTPLSIAVRLLPTPRASDGEKGGPNQRGSSGDLTLPSAAVRLLPTPTAQAHSRNQTANRTDPKATTNTSSPTLLDVFWTGEPTDPPSPDGST